MSTTALAPTTSDAMSRQLVIGGNARQRELTGDEKAAVLLLSLGLSLNEIYISTKALEIELKDMLDE